VFKSDSARADSSCGGRRKEPSCSARKGGAMISVEQKPRDLQQD
jgi:hypothetical protein